jgi:hypothetical protein
MRVSFAIVLSVFFNLNHSNGQWITHDNFSEEEITKTLKEFYTIYVRSLGLPFTDRHHDKIDSVLNRYCTLNLLNQVRGDWANYSLLNNHDSDLQMLKTLTIQKDSKLDDLYYVSYLFQNKKTTIKLLLVRLRGKYKIDYVWRDYNNTFLEQRITKMLKDFYVNYITETGTDFENFNASKKTDWNKVDSLLSKYCTANLLMETADAHDYDPFLKGQMSDWRMLKNLTVQKDPIHNDIYSVSYTYGDGKVTMRFIIINWNGRFKIDYLWLD